MVKPVGWFYDGEVYETEQAACDSPLYGRKGIPEPSPLYGPEVVKQLEAAEKVCVALIDTRPSTECDCFLNTNRALGQWARVYDQQTKGEGDV